MSDQETVLLHVSDWNNEDKWYELPLSILKEFGKMAIRDHRVAWSWLVGQVDYNGDQHEKPVKRCDHCVNHNLNEFFFDWYEPAASVKDWELSL